jgi:hypothetical protein
MPKKLQRFGEWICLLLQAIRTEEETTLFFPLETANL